MLILLGICAYTDLRYRKIPDIIIVLMLFCSMVLSRVQITERIAGFILPALPLFLLALRNAAVKGGDIKFFAASGLYFGLSELSVILVWTTISALLWSVIKKERSVPLCFVFLLGYLLSKITERIML